MSAKALSTFFAVLILVVGIAMSGTVLTEAANILGHTDVECFPLVSTTASWLPSVYVIGLFGLAGAIGFIGARGVRPFRRLRPVAAAALVTMVMVLPTMATPGEQAATFPDDWTHKEQFTGTNSTDKSGSASWQFKIDLSNSDDASTLFAQMQSSGADIRVTSDEAGTNVLSHWIQEIDTGTNTGIVWVKSDSPPGASSSFGFWVWAGNSSASSTSSGSDVFGTFEDFDDPDSLRTALENADQNTHRIGNVDRYSTLAAADGQAGSWKEDNILESSSVFYDPTEADASRLYKLYFTGVDSNGSTPRKVGAYFSPDGDTWTEYDSNPLVEDIDDIEVHRDSGGTLHAWGEDPAQPGVSSDIRYFTVTSNGTTFSDQGLVVERGAATEWDDNRVGSPEVIENSSGTYIMLYDGEPGDADQKLGVATANSAAGPWTKNSNNPQLDLANAIVPVDFWQTDDGTYWALIFTGSVRDVLLYKNEVADPTTWQSTDWALVSRVGRFDDLHIFENDSRQSVILTIRGESTATDNKILRADVLGTTDVLVGLHGNLDDDPEDDPTFSKLEMHSDELKFIPVTDSSTYSFYVRDNRASVTNDIAVGFRAKKNSTDGAYMRVSLGSGDVVSGSSNDQWATFNNGYSLLFGTSGSANSRFQRADTGTMTNLGVDFTLSGLLSYANYEIRYQSDGTLALVQNGSTIASRSDSNHAAATKNVMITQGLNSSNWSDSYYDWYYVRNYDGDDPSLTGQGVTALETESTC